MAFCGLRLVSFRAPDAIWTNSYALGSDVEPMATSTVPASCFGVLTVHSVAERLEIVALVFPKEALP